MRKNVFYSCFRTAESFDYIVKEGDTFGGIATSCQIDIKDLEEANKFDEILLCPGQKIVVPQPGANKAYYFEEYVVEPAEKINSIAGKFNIQPSLLLKYNDISRLKLLENQVLRIPRRRKYKIKEGDTLESILREHNLDFERFIETNLKVWLRPGNEVYIE